MQTEKQCQLWSQWNEATTEFEDTRCLHTLFEAQTERNPSSTALVFADRQFNYSELNQQANRLAHHLIDLGVGAESIVAICTDRCIEMIVAILAIHKAGGAYIPLEPDMPADRLAYMLEDTNATTLLAQRVFESRAESMALQIDTFYLDDEHPAWSGKKDSNPGLITCPKNLAYVLYTSGSTGKPKGVMIEHNQLIQYTLAVIHRLQIDEPMSYAMVQPLTVDSSVTVVQSSLITGGILHIVPKETTLDPDAFEAYFSKHSIDVMKLAPSHLAALLPRSVIPNKLLILGGEALKWDLVKKLDLSKGTRLINHYGPTETTVGVLTNEVDSENISDGTGSSVPIGKPLANTQAYIFDEHLRATPPGEPGELYIGGPLVARGYLNLSKQTHASFVPDPKDPTRRLYRTGDLARYLESGDIEYLGRSDNQLKVRGLRLEPGEIEQSILKDARVREAVVTGYVGLENQTELVAYIVAEQNHNSHQNLIDELRVALAEELPSYMIPMHWHLLDELPRSRHGKLDLGALNARMKMQDSVKPTSTESLSEPEKQVAAVWQEVLGANDISKDKNFFELGGNSLSAIRLSAKLKDKCGIRIPTVLFFQGATIADIAKKLPDNQSDTNLPSSAQSEEVNENIYDEQQPLRSTPAVCRLISKTAGSRPFFMFGSNPRYASATKNLHPDNAVYQLDAYALQLNLKLAKKPVPKSIEAIATALLAEIKEVQSSGPYRLGGGCEGALIAYEVAQQLQRQGESIENLMTWHTNAPGPQMRKGFDGSTLKRLWWQFQSVLSHGQPHRLSFGEYVELIRHEIIEYSLFSAMYKYSPTSQFNGELEIMVLEPSDGSELDKNSPTYRDHVEAWQSLTDGDLRISFLQGTHETWLKDHVDFFAKHLALRLN